MNPFTASSKIVITCKNRLAPYVAQEVEALGFKLERTFLTGVEVHGTMNDCIRLNLNLRCASQVLYSLKQFRANSPDEVYQILVGYPWQEIIANDGYVSVTSTVDNFTVNNNLFVNVKVKDAITDRIRRETGARPDSGPELDFSVVNLYWKEEAAEVFIDTSGHTLAKHGYRKIPGKAPMLEALAAATVMASRWDRRSPFINPMCGSSTLAIEAILLATHRSPGLYRSNYGFMHVTGYEEAVYQSELTLLQKQIVEVPGLHVVATDNREDAIEISKVNAATAGVEQFIQFTCCDFEKTEIPVQPGVIFFNPEYGERMGEVAELEGTYAQLGDFMKKKCLGYTGYIFTGNMDLAKKIGLRASRRIEFYNAMLDCRLLEYELYSGTKREVRMKSNAN